MRMYILYMLCNRTLQQVEYVFVHMYHYDDGLDQAYNLN